LVYTKRIFKDEILSAGYFCEVTHIVNDFSLSQSTIKVKTYFGQSQVNGELLYEPPLFLYETSKVWNLNGEKCGKRKKSGLDHRNQKWRNGFGLPGHRGIDQTGIRVTGYSFLKWF